MREHLAFVPNAPATQGLVVFSGLRDGGGDGRVRCLR